MSNIPTTNQPVIIKNKKEFLSLVKPLFIANPEFRANISFFEGVAKVPKTFEELRTDIVSFKHLTLNDLFAIYEELQKSALKSDKKEDSTKSLKPKEEVVNS